MIPVFVGPTWPELHLEPPPGLLALPPAGRGDIARLLAVRPLPPAIGVIDGVFETSRSLWHKEILLALEMGVAVFGAASLGALRAAELAPHGMAGVGRVYDLYRAGLIERDDAVMVAHAPAALGFQPLSVALVDIEATADALAPELGEGEAALLRAVAALLHFGARSWEAVARAFAAELGDPARAAPMAELLRARAVGLKRADAQALVRALGAWSRHPAPPPRVAVPRTTWLRALAAEHGLALP